MTPFYNALKYQNKGCTPACPSLLVFVLGSFLLSGCIETISFDVDRTGNHLVVDGMITDTEGPHLLKLRRTSNQKKITDPQSGASIRIMDDMGNSEDYYETKPGTYELAGSVVEGIPGRRYSIEITLPGGARYRSEPELMPAAVASDSILYEFDTVEVLNEYGNSVDFEVIRILRNTNVPVTADALFLKWEVEEVYKFTEYDYPDPFNAPPPSCYITDYPDPQTIRLYDGSELKGGNLDTEVMVERELDESFFQRHYLNVIQYSMTRKAHEYWTRVDQVVNQSGTIFDVPPANAKNNLSNVDDPGETVLGYFHAVTVDTSRIFVTRFDLPIEIFNPCNTPIGPDCNGGCSKFDNSSPDPPAYWLQDLGNPD